MNATRWFCCLVFAAMATPAVRAQETPKPGPEFEILTKMVGTWDLTMKISGAEAKGTVTYKMELGGMWLTSSLESELFGTKFSGKGLDTYNEGKKKYISVWVDSMTTAPTVMEGTYDKAKKTLTLAGDGPGMDGKPTKFKSTSEFPDSDTINFNMYMGDDKDAAFTIIYKRKKQPVK